MLILLYIVGALLGAHGVPYHARHVTRGANSYAPPLIDLPPVTTNREIHSDAYARLAKLLPRSLEHSIQISTHSWELGTLMTTLVEVYNPELSSFGSRFVPNDVVPWHMLKVAAATLSDYSFAGCPSSVGEGEADLARYLSPNTSPVALSLKPLFRSDGSLGDPASMGPAIWMLANHAKRDDVRTKLGLRQTGQDYVWAVGGQLHYLLQGTKHDIAAEGHFELWSDMGYMIPPFPAYLGLATNNPGLVKVGVNQWILESSALLDVTKDLYRHVHNWDTKFWTTGNDWMLYGAVRLLGIIRSAGWSKEFAAQVQQIQGTISNVFKAMFAQLNPNGLIPNYMFENDPVLSSGDASGTAMAVAAYYRFLLLAPEMCHSETTRLAERAFDAVVRQIDDDGWLNNVVDPMGTNGWIVGSKRSPEGQAFLGSMFAARTAVGSFGDIDHIQQTIQSSIEQLGDHV